MFRNSTTLIFQELKCTKDLNKTKLECKNGILDVICKVTTIIQYYFLETMGYGSSTEKSICFKPNDWKIIWSQSLMLLILLFKGLRAGFVAKNSVLSWNYFTLDFSKFHGNYFSKIQICVFFAIRKHQKMPMCFSEDFCISWIPKETSIFLCNL